MCYNGFTIKLNLLKCERFKDGRCRYKTVVSSHPKVYTVKPVLSGHRIKRTISIKRTVAEVLKFISLIYFT